MPRRKSLTDIGVGKLRPRPTATPFLILTCVDITSASRLGASNHMLPLLVILEVNKFGSRSVLPTSCLSLQRDTGYGRQYSEFVPVCP